MGPSWSRRLRLLLLASLLALSAVAALQPSPGAGRRPPLPPEPPSAADVILARMCDPRGTRAGAAPPSWCHGPHLRRHRGAGAARHQQHRPVPVPLPPPGRDGGEEVDVRYGVAKRLVPTGPNPLHN